MTTPWEYCAQTGYQPMDVEHKDIVERIDGLVKQLDNKQLSAIASTLDEIFVRLIAHFQHEEGLMAQIQYPQMAAHKDAHDVFLKDVDKHRLDLKNSGYTEPFRLWAVRRFADWFRLHIKTYDIGLAKQIMKNSVGA
jgi:hemerythrin-like metal-binding protein